MKNLNKYVKKLYKNYKKKYYNLVNKLEYKLQPHWVNH